MNHKIKPAKTGKVRPSTRWQLLAERMSRRYYSEYELEGRFEDCLYFIFGWQNIGRQEPVRFGHETKRLDLVLRDNDDVPVVMIEMKKQALDPAAENADAQLKSYMLADGYRTKFGLLVGDRLSLYFDDGKRVSRVLSLSFHDSNSALGEELANYLMVDNFDVANFAKFCQKKLSEPQPPLLGEETCAKLLGLLELYKVWMAGAAPHEERKYMKNLDDAIDWARKRLIRADLARLSDHEFVELFREIPGRFTNIRSSMRYYINNRSNLLDKRVDFARAMAHLAKAPVDRRFLVLNDFISGDFRVKNLGKAFWSEMIRARFDDVPLLNQKTLDFFKSIGVFLGDSYGEELANVAKFYTELQKHTRGEFTLNELTHLEHFARQVPAGREFVKYWFGMNDSGESC